MVSVALPYAGCYQLKKQFSRWRAYNAFLGRTNLGSPVLLPRAVSKDRNAFGTPLRKDLRAAISCMFVQVGKARVTKGCN